MKHSLYYLNYMDVNIVYYLDTIHCDIKITNYNNVIIMKSFFFFFNVL